MVLGKFFSFNLTFKKRLRFKGSWIFFGWVKSSGVQEEVAASYFWLVWVLITGDASPLAWRGNCWSKRQPSWRVAENQYCNSKTPLLDTNCKCTNTKLLVEEKIREMILLLLLKGLSPECDSKTIVSSLTSRQLLQDVTVQVPAANPASWSESPTSFPETFKNSWSPFLSFLPSLLLPFFFPSSFLPSLRGRAVFLTASWPFSPQLASLLLWNHGSYDPTNLFLYLLFFPSFW